MLEQTKKLLDSFESYVQKRKPTKPVIILLNGVRIQTSSGKSLWKRIGDAKSALRLHVDYETNIYLDFTARNTNKKYMINGSNERFTWEEAKELKEKIIQEVFSAVVFKELEY